MARRGSLYVALASGLALAATLTFLSPAAAQTSCSVSAADQAVDTEESRALELINEYRAQNGLGRLSVDPALVRAAAWFSRDMATKKYFAGNHVDSLGRDIPTRVTDCGASWTYVTENLAAGFGDAKATFEQWRTSASHNAAMLRPEVTGAGIGRAFNAASSYEWYWALDLTAGGSAAIVSPPAAPAPPTAVVPPPPANTLGVEPGPLPPPPTELLQPAIDLAPTNVVPPPPPDRLPPANSPPPLSGDVPVTAVVPPPSGDVPVTAVVPPPAPAQAPVALPLEATTTSGNVLPTVCALLQAQRAATDGQLAAVEQAVAGSLGLGGLESLAAQLAGLRSEAAATIDAARAAAGCAGGALGDLDVVTAATAS